jgi:hypothetical protein
VTVLAVVGEGVSNSSSNPSMISVVFGIMTAGNTT